MTFYDQIFVIKFLNNFGYGFKSGTGFSKMPGSGTLVGGGGGGVLRGPNSENLNHRCGINFGIISNTATEGY
jgi:hypothetical protein